jgi:hypothetical protein
MTSIVLKMNEISFNPATYFLGIIGFFHFYGGAQAAKKKPVNRLQH